MIRVLIRVNVAIVASAAVSFILGCGGGNAQNAPPAPDAPVAPGTLNAPDPPNVQPSSTATQVRSADYPNSISIGNAKISTMSISLTKPMLRNDSGASHPKDASLVLLVSVTNVSQTGKLFLSGWPSAQFPDNYRAVDDRGVTYRPAPYPLGSIVGDVKDKYLAPGESGRTYIVFERPSEDARRLTITLDGNGVEQGDAKFQWKVEKTQWAK